MPINYEEGKIYKLVNNTSTDCYYGSTCDHLHKRKHGHKTDYKKFLAGTRHFITSFKILEPLVDDCDIVLVEAFPCSNKQELHARERWWIENNECVNKVIPTRTTKEYREDNKDKINQQNKEYRDANKDKIRQQQKEYRERKKNITA